MKKEMKIMKQIVEIDIINNFLHSRYMAIDAFGDSVLEKEEYFPRSTQGMEELYIWAEKQDVKNGSALVVKTK